MRAVRNNLLESRQNFRPAFDFHDQSALIRFNKPFDVQPAVRAAMAGARLRGLGFLTGVTIEVEVTDSLSSVSAP
jgi:hypothetical protein